MPVVVRRLEWAFRYFGGVPLELLFDQMSAVIVRDGRREEGRLVENREFLRFSQHWGFRNPVVPSLSGADRAEGRVAEPLHP